MWPGIPPSNDQIERMLKAFNDADLMTKMSKYPPVGLDDALRFGKHKGKELWEVLEKDLSYVTWLIDEAGVRLDNEAFAEYQRRLKNGS